MAMMSCSEEHHVHHVGKSGGYENNDKRRQSSLELGQQSLLRGDFEAAIQHLNAELLSEGDGVVDAHLLLAEALWQRSGGRGDAEALQHYEAAAALAHKAGDYTKEGMVALGHGFALSKLGQAAAARNRLEHARSLAEADGNLEAAKFVSNMLAEISDVPDPEDEAEVTRKTWSQFAEAVASGKSVQLFLRGTIAAPSDSASWTGAARLRAVGCQQFESMDVETPGDCVPEGLQAISRSPHLKFPQLFIQGSELEGWLDITVDQLRQRLEEAGVSLGEMPAAEPCHGTAAFTDGLDAWEVALVELVSKEGAGDWHAKAKVLLDHMPALMAATTREMKTDDVADEAVALQAAWDRLAPIIKDKLGKQPEMPCGHSCETCPTRHDCQLHDAVEGGKVKDIEDLA
jgi:glutaredoxin-related protein